MKGSRCDSREGSRVSEDKEKAAERKASEEERKLQRLIEVAAKHDRRANMLIANQLKRNKRGIDNRKKGCL